MREELTTKNIAIERLKINDRLPLKFYIFLIKKIFVPVFITEMDGFFKMHQFLCI